jgi:adenylate cyclase
LGSVLGSDDAFALARSAHVLTYIGREYDRGMSMVEQATALNPNLAIAWYSRGWVALMCGEAATSIESFDHMIRLSPLDPLRLGAWNGSSFALFSLGRYEEGCASAMKSMQIVKDAHTLVAYIVNAVNGGRTVEAGEAATQLLKLQPDFRASHVEQAFPVRSSSERSRMTSALREAGLPD